ncbi:MAG: hypothetical protein AAGA54_18065 [Myxococcota bacterium]
MRLRRRTLLTSLAATAAAGGALLRRPAAAHGGRPSKFLITLGAFGGASIIDAMLAISDSEVDAVTAETLNVFPREEVFGSADYPFRAVDRTAAPFFGETYVSRQRPFVDAHHQDMLVVTQTGTSVNHAVGQKRSITGNNAWNGRTLQEAVAMAYGEGKALPNVTMGALGFREDGGDDQVPAWARAHSVDDPRRWPLSLDALHGIDDAPTRDVLALARGVRDEQLDPHTKFTQTFLLSERLKAWKAMRADDVPRLEDAQLLQKLNFGLQDPLLPAFDPTDRAALEAAFGHLTVDPLQMQAAMAYLLIKHGLSVSVTLSPTWNVVTNNEATGDETRILNTPLSFDYSHTSHRATQTMMWTRMLDTLDALVGLLDATEHPEDPGTSLFDHTVLYVATDFGRTKNRPANAAEFSTGHDLNNGNLLLSGSLLAGGTVLGGVDPTTGMTYGYDTTSGAPMPDTQMGERTLYAGILDAMQVDTTGSGLPSVPAMRAG